MIRAGAPDTMLPRLLSEIDETVLPRRVTLTAGAARELVVAVANGRILRIEAADEVPGADDLIGEELQAGDQAVIDALQAVFAALVGEEDKLLVRHDALGDAVDPGRAGLSAESLAQGWNTPFAPTELTEDEELAGVAVDNFLQATQAEVTAWLMTGPETPESEGAGDPDTVDELTAFAEARRETGEASRQVADAKGEPWSFLVLRRGADADEVTVIVAVDGILLYLAVAQENLGKVADAWRAAVPG